MIKSLPPELVEQIREIAKKVCPTTESPGMMLIVQSYIETAETAILEAYPLIAAHVAKRAAEICRRKGKEFDYELMGDEIAAAIERELGGKDEQAGG